MSGSKADRIAIPPPWRVVSPTGIIHFVRDEKAMRALSRQHTIADARHGLTLLRLVGYNNMNREKLPLHHKNWQLLERVHWLQQPKSGELLPLIGGDGGHYVEHFCGQQYRPDTRHFKSTRLNSLTNKGWLLSANVRCTEYRCKGQRVGDGWRVADVAPPDPERHGLLYVPYGPFAPPSPATTVVDQPVAAAAHPVTIAALRAAVAIFTPRPQLPSATASSASASVSASSTAHATINVAASSSFPASTSAVSSTPIEPADSMGSHGDELHAAETVGAICTSEVVPIAGVPIAGVHAMETVANALDSAVAAFGACTDLGRLKQVLAAHGHLTDEKCRVVQQLLRLVQEAKAEAAALARGAEAKARAKALAADKAAERAAEKVAEAEAKAEAKAAAKALATEKALAAAAAKQVEADVAKAAAAAMKAAAASEARGQNAHKAGQTGFHKRKRQPSQTGVDKNGAQSIAGSVWSQAAHDDRCTAIRQRSDDVSACNGSETVLPGASEDECEDVEVVQASVVDPAADSDDVVVVPATMLARPCHVEAAAAMVKAHAAAAASALAAAEAHDGVDTACERCCISGCDGQLLRCGDHILCAPCLDRWFVSRNQLRDDAGLCPLARRTCPVCQRELRAARHVDAGMYMGLPKIDASW